MLSEKREKLTITVKKENKKRFDELPENEKQNILKQVDYLIENNFPFTEEEVLAIYEKAEKRIQNGEQYLTIEELKAKLGV